MWDTPYSFMTEADFTCALGRGQKSNALFLVNHWLGRPFADLTLAREVNVAAVLGDRVTKCTTEAGRAPTFVSVDFYDVGDLFGVVRKRTGSDSERELDRSDQRQLDLGAHRAHESGAAMRSSQGTFVVDGSYGIGGSASASSRPWR